MAVLLQAYMIVSTLLHKNNSISTFHSTSSLKTKITQRKLGCEPWLLPDERTGMESPLNSLCWDKLAGFCASFRLPQTSVKLQPSLCGKRSRGKATGSKGTVRSRNSTSTRCLETTESTEAGRLLMCNTVGEMGETGKNLQQDSKKQKDQNIRSRMIEKHLSEFWGVVETWPTEITRSISPGKNNLVGKSSWKS